MVDPSIRDSERFLRRAGRRQFRDYDVLIRGGDVLDPSQGLRGPRDVALAFGRVAKVAPAGSIDPAAAAVAVDATGRLVVPGLIDLHTHVYAGGSELVIPADEVCGASGSTTVVDAGTSGAHTIGGLRRLARDLRTRIYCFVHIATIGLAGHPVGESLNLDHLDVDAAAYAVRSHDGFCIGIKVRQTRNIVGDNGLEPLRRAVRAAETAQCPVMVHIGNAPEPLPALLELLRPGDVVTHCFTGTGNGVVDDQYRILDACRAARERGVRFDLGHGRGSFSFRIAKAGAEQDFWPDTISTDLHSASVNHPVVDLPTTLSKFLHLGMPLEEVVARATIAPAQWINAGLPPSAREELLGTLQEGAPGDLAVLAQEEGECPLYDSYGNHEVAARRLVATNTVRGGLLWGRPYPHPYLS